MKNNYHFSSVAEPEHPGDAPKIGGSATLHFRSTGINFGTGSFFLTLSSLFSILCHLSFKDSLSGL